jgi:hypothetical protein
MSRGSETTYPNNEVSQDLANIKSVTFSFGTLQDLKVKTISFNPLVFIEALF